MAEEDDYPIALTLQQAARKVGKSEKTLRRWIQNGKLKAEKHPIGGYLIKREDLAAVAKTTPEWTANSELADLRIKVSLLEAAVEELQYMVRDLEDSIEDLKRKKTATVTRSTTTRRKKKKKVPSREWLPDYLVGLASFAEDHGITPALVSKAIRERRLFPEHGVWKDGYKTVRAALDDRGCQEFYDLFCEHPKFKRCFQCPHHQRW